MTAGKIVKRLGLALAGFFCLLLIAGLCLPSQVVISRSAGINAPPAAIYPLLSDFRTGWTRWNSFDDEDPGIQYSYAGPASGQGAMQTWTSEKMGDGSMTITKADSSRGVEFDLLIGPQSFKLKGTLAMDPRGAATTVTWTDRMDLGKSPFKRLMGPVLSKMIGSSFEKSLASIKQIAESSAAAR
jgi:hypothetical protein